MVVVEDIPEMRTRLKNALLFLKAKERTVRPLKMLTHNMPQESEIQFSAREIIDTVNFAGKSESLVLWLADACAFGLRRYLSRLKYGDEYARAILGDQPMLESYAQATQEQAMGAALFVDSKPPAQ
jgi:hypothetical protein